MDRGTGRPPPHLEGSLMVQFVKGKGNHNWKTKFLTVLQETLSVYDSEQKWKQGKQELISIKLTEANITNITAKRVPQGCSVNWAFCISFKDLEVQFLASSSDEFKFWFEGFQYVKKFWSKQISIEMSKKIKEQARISPNMPGASFTTTVIDVHGFTHSLTLHYDAKFNDVYRAIYRPQGNNSSRGSLRMLREQGAQIWGVDETGSDFMVRKLEEIHPYVENGCQLFLLEQGYKVLVIYSQDKSFVAIPVQPNITVAQVIGASTVSEWVQNLGYEEAKLVRVVENDKEIPLRDTDRPVEVFYELVDSGIWRRKADVQDKLMLKEKPCDQLGHDAILDDENSALTSGMPIPEIAVPDLPPVYRTPSLRGKSPIKEMFQGLTKLKSSEATGSLHNDSKYEGSLQLDKSDLEHRAIVDENNRSEQDRAKGVDKKMGKNLEGRQTLAEGTTNRRTLNSASTYANDVASESQRVGFQKSGKRKSVDDFAEPSFNEEETDRHGETSSYVSKNRQNSPSENRRFEEKKGEMSHGFSGQSVREGVETEPASGNLSENSRNSTLCDTKERRSARLDVMSRARTHHETRSEFQNTEVCYEKGLKNEFQEICEPNVVCKENKTTDEMVGHMISDAAEKSEICITVNRDTNKERISDTGSDFANALGCYLDSSPSGEQYLKQEDEKGKQDTEFTKQNENGINDNPDVINKPNPEGKDKRQLGDSIVDERDLSATRRDYMSSKPVGNDIDNLQAYLEEASENQPQNIDIDKEKPQSDQCPVKVNVEIYEPDNIPVVGETIAMILPTSNNASVLTTLQTKSSHDTETSDDDDDDASSVSSIESFMNKQDGSLPESEQMAAQRNSAEVSDGVLRNPDFKNEIHQPGGETKSDTIIVDGNHENVADKNENESPSMETKSNAEGIDKKQKTDVAGHSPLNSRRTPSREPSQQNKIPMEDVQQLKEKEASAADNENRRNGSLAHAGGSLNKNRRRNAFRESALIKEVRMETVRRLSNERLERERQQRMNEGQLEDCAAVGYGDATEDDIKMGHDAAEETEALNKRGEMHAETSSSEKEAASNSETGLSTAETRSLIDEHTTGNSRPIATAATTTTATTPITEVAASTATSDAKVRSENEVNPDISPLRVPCSTCENLKKRPWQVVKYKEMETVLKQCTKKGKEANTENRYDHICLSGVHLRIKQGEWEVTDGTFCHSESELTDSLEMMKTTTSQQDRDSIASKIVKEKQVKLKGGICCHWIPRRAAGTWRVTRFTEENLNVEQSRDDDEEDWKIRAIPSPCFNETNEENASHPENADEEHVSVIDPVQATQAVPVQSIFTEAKESLSRKLSTTMKGMLSHIPSQRPSSPSQVYMSLEMIEVRERLIVPLYRAVNQIRKHFVNAPPECLAHQVGDDSVNPSIGWLVRRDVCSALSALLLAGMKSDSAILKFVVSRSNQLNLFSLVKNVCRSCVEEPVLEIVVKVIEESPFLFDDSLRFRNFVCEALNWQNEAYTEKLLVTWFKTFVKLKHVIEKFYKKGSLWKLQGAERAGLVEEVIIILENLNVYRFTLHADFEHKELAKRMEEEQMAFMLQRDPPDVDMEVMVFE